MSSEVFRKTMAQALGSKFKGKYTGQQIDIIEKATLKQISLVSTIRARSDSSSDGFFLDDPQIKDFFKAAESLVDDILLGLANEDIEELTNQVTKRVYRTSTTNVSWGLFRDKKGKILSGFNLERLLNLTLQIYAQKHMGVDGQLKNRTGRLANSGVVTGIESDAPARTASFFFTYMLYPYEVFENRPNGRYSGTEYSPIKLFQDAIDYALRDLLSNDSYKNLTANIIFRGDVNEFSFRNNQIVYRRAKRGTRRYR